MSPKRRIFIKRNANRMRLSIVLVVGLLVAVAACAPESAQWSPLQSQKRNDVRWITFEHVARFAGSGETLNSDETARLQAFLRRHDAGYGDQLLIGATGQREGDAVIVAARREAAVSTALRQRDLKSRLLPQTPSGDVWDGTVRVILGRFVVVPPDCPDWSKRADGDPANTESSNFGCATATNLGLMVANPEDLVRGRRAGPADGAVGARRYRTYREGEQKSAPAITPLMIQSGVGGGSGQ